jgi:hypothetical protein
MTRVVIESPFAGDVTRNLAYLRACMADCLARGEAPYASHGLYTQPGVLDDDKPDERQKGIVAGYAWSEAAHVVAFYVDLGLSKGMQAALERLMDQPGGVGVSNVIFRRLGGEWVK